jgi:hypothetical protein
MPHKSDWKDKVDICQVIIEMWSFRFVVKPCIFIVKELQEQLENMQKKMESSKLRGDKLFDVHVRLFFIAHFSS